MTMPYVSGLPFQSNTNCDDAILAAHHALRARAFEAACFSGHGTLVAAGFVPPTPPSPILIAGVSDDPPRTYTVSVDFPIGVEWRASGDVPTTPSEVPHFAELLLCIFTRPERQKERLGCYAELFNEWEQKFDAATARRLYYLHVLRSVWDIIKIGTAAVVIDRVWNWITGK